MAEEDAGPLVHFRLECRTASEVTRLSVAGNFQREPWHLGTAHDLKYSEASGGCCLLALLCWRAGAAGPCHMPLKLAGLRQVQAGVPQAPGRSAVHMHANRMRARPPPAAWAALPRPERRQ